MLNSQLHEVNLSYILKLLSYLYTEYDYPQSHAIMSMEFRALNTKYKHRDKFKMSMRYLGISHFCPLGYIP